MTMLAGCVPFPPEFAETYRRAGYWQGKTLGEYLDDWAQRYGDREAIVGATERITYRELARRSDWLAWGLLRLGIHPRDRVVVQLPNVPDFVSLCFALFRIGALPVMALPAHREYEITHLVEHAEASAYAVPASFGNFDYLELARAVRAQSRCLQYILVSGEGDDPDVTYLGRLAAEESRAPTADAPDTPESAPLPRLTYDASIDEVRVQLSAYRPDPADIAFFLLSGGTTGRPKLIPRTHDDYTYNFRASAELCHFGPDTVYLVTLPVAHNFPLGCPGLLGTLHAGGKAVMAPSPDPEYIFPLIERERVTATAVVPALAIRWMESPLRTHYDLSSLRLLQVGGARLAPEAARRVRPLLGCTLQQVFGMAEGLLNYTRLDDPDEVIVETQGRPLSPHDEIRIVDAYDEPVPPGEMGNLLTRGPYTIRGYYKAEAHNKEAFTADGFYRSGDVVRLHPSGNLVVEGRAKDLINRGGEKISAEEVENLILAHPKVLNAAVVAMPDRVLGERACAFVILREGEDLTLAELVTFLLAHKMARFMLPERLEVVPAFPLTSVGKVDKKALRELIAQKLRQEASIS
jgi:2,3-dihydroxybenzoate-AMP ligase